MIRGLQVMRDGDLVKSQNATSRNGSFFEGQDGGRRKMPYALTEQGIYMLATVLRGELAEQQSISLWGFQQGRWAETLCY